MTQPIEKFIWDLTYACPLRCVHCYSESGRRSARMLDRDNAMRVVDIILSAGPKCVSISGGEPLLVPWCTDAARYMHNAGIIVTLFTSGWVMNEQMATELATSVAGVAVSVDGPSREVHDKIRGRHGSFDRAMGALDILDGTKREACGTGRGCYSIGIDYTITRSGASKADLVQFVEDVTSRFQNLDFVRFGAVIPEGLAAEEGFDSELLTFEESLSFLNAENWLAERARNRAEVSITDVRYFLPEAGSNTTDRGIAHIEPDGKLRAKSIYEAKVGNVLEESLDVLWARAMAWRSDPFVVAEMDSIRTMSDWARVTRTLDRRYGSVEDKERIRMRGSAFR